MSSPVFDKGTGQRFGQKILDNLLYGINLADERNFAPKIHLSSSILNFALIIPSIVICFIGKTTTILIIQAVVSFVIALIYFVFSFIPKQRQQQKIKDVLSKKDQFFNALMYCYHQFWVKLWHLLVAAALPIIYQILVTYTTLHPVGIIFVQMMTSSSLRQIDSTMAKYRPVNQFEPSLSNLIFIAGFSCISLAQPILSVVLIILLPIFLTFGFIPQIECLIYGIFDSLSLYLNQPINIVQSVVFGSSIIASFVIRPIETFIGIFIFSIIQWKMNQILKAIIQTIVIVCTLGVSIAFYLVKFQNWWRSSTIIINSDTIHYIVLILGAMFSIVEFIFQYLNQKKVHKSGNNQKLIIAWNYLLHIPALVVVALLIIDNIQTAVYEDHLYSAMLMRIIGLAVFNPQLCMISSFLGGIINFGFKLLTFSTLSLSIVIMSLIYVGCEKFILIMTYYKHMKKLAFKVTDSGWQKRFYKIRGLLWIYNSFIAFICAMLNTPPNPIGGTPFFIPGHLHARQFFVTKSNAKLYNDKNVTEDTAITSIDGKDDIIIYNRTVQQLSKHNAELSLLLKNSNMKQGELLLMMQGKQVIFIQNLGQNAFHSSNNVIVSALETKETSCHTLERTCLERYYELVSQQNNQKQQEPKITDNEKVLQSTTYVQSPHAVQEYRSAISPLGKRKQPITLGQRPQKQNENRLPAKVPELSGDWMQKYLGAFSLQSLDETAFSLAGMFLQRQVFEDLQVLVVGFSAILIKQTGNLLQNSSNILNNGENSGKFDEILKELPWIREYSSILKEICKSNLFNLQKESELVEMFINGAKDLKEPLKSILQEAVRLAIYHYIQATAVGDDLPKSQQEFTALKEETKDVFMGDPQSEEWKVALKSKTKFFTLQEGPRALSYSSKSLKWYCFKLPRFYYQSIWSSVQSDLLVFNSTNDERFSVQSLPQCLRNILCEAAPGQFGYQLVGYGEMTI